MTDREEWEAASEAAWTDYTWPEGRKPTEPELFKAVFHAAWQAAIKLEREACAVMVESRAGMRGTGAWVALTAAADAIRARSEDRDG